MHAGQADAGSPPNAALPSLCQSAQVALQLLARCGSHLRVGPSENGADGAVGSTNGTHTVQHGGSPGKQPPTDGLGGFPNPESVLQSMLHLAQAWCALVAGCGAVGGRAGSTGGTVTTLRALADVGDALHRTLGALAATWLSRALCAPVSSGWWGGLVGGVGGGGEK